MLRCLIPLFVLGVSFVASNNVDDLKAALEKAQPCVEGLDPMPTIDTTQEKTYVGIKKRVDLTKGKVSGISDYSIDQITEKVNSPTSSTFTVTITFNDMEINYDYDGGWWLFSNSGTLKSTVMGSVVQYKINKVNGKYEAPYEISIRNSGMKYLKFNGGFLGAFLEVFQIFLYDICERVHREIILPEILGIVTECLPAP